MTAIMTVKTNGPALDIKSYARPATDKVAKAIGQLASGSKLEGDAASTALYNKMDSNRQILIQAQDNAQQGCAVLTVAQGNTKILIDMVTRGLVLATKVNNSALGEDAALVGAEFYATFGEGSDEPTSTTGMFMDVVQQVRWGTQALFMGNPAKTDIQQPAQDEVTVSGLKTSQGGFNATDAVTLDPASTLKVLGDVSDISVTGPANAQIISMTVGGATFKNAAVFDGATAADGGAAVDIVLTHQTTDPAGAAVIVSQITLHTSAAPVNLKTTAGTKAALEKTFGGATFSSNAVALPAGFSVKATPEAPKKFFIQIDAAAGPQGYKLRDYKTGKLIAQASTAPPAAPADDKTEMIDFGNGVTLIRQAGTALAAADSAVFDTEIGLPLTFQIGQESTDTLTVIMPKITKETFSLDGMYVTEYTKPDGTLVLAPEAAAQSAEKLKEALNALNNLTAELGSLYLQLDTATNNTASSVTNLTKAESSVGDADPISALIDMKAGESLLQLAYNGLPTAFRITTMIVDSIAAANR